VKEPETAQLSQSDAQAVRQLNDAFERLKKQVATVIVGQEEVVEQLMMCIFARGHAILEGVPGLAKTLLVSTVAKCLKLEFARIQFTPDLMPSDITGTEVIQENKSTGAREFKFLHGPIFAHIILADEINRTPPKTQAALLEAMQERQVSAGGRRHPMKDPFFVLATQNPIEQEGTYPLPEAQQDRFMYKIFVRYPKWGEELDVIRRTTADITYEPEPVLDGETILHLQHLIRRITASEEVMTYAMRLVRSTRVMEEGAPKFIRDNLSWGAGPRACQYLILGGKARAALLGRYQILPEDVAAVAKPVLRHRLITNFNADAAGITTDAIVEELLKNTPVKAQSPELVGQP
jgi:MoxR-like ATPase